VDTFLANWLTRQTVEAVSAKHLYDRFLSFAREAAPRGEDGKLAVAALMEDIARDAERFREIEQPQGTSRFHTFLCRLSVLDIVVFQPLLLELMGRAGTDQDDRDRAGLVLESYLVRRVVCGYQTRGYSTLALSLLDRLKALPKGEPATPALIAALESATGSDCWPSDDVFRAEWCRRKFYGTLRRSRVLMILQAIEEHYQRESIKSEPVLTFNFDQLEVEHILPQAWEAQWPLDESVTSSEDRNWRLHGIGNLTLVSGSLNKDLKNGPWYAVEGKPSKRAGLQAHSKLELNARLLNDYAGGWHEAAMKSRAERLFEAARLIWPAPHNIA
jgi:hypothetical protein